MSIVCLLFTWGYSLRDLCGVPIRHVTVGIPGTVIVVFLCVVCLLFMCGYSLRVLCGVPIRRVNAGIPGTVCRLCVCVCAVSVALFFACSVWCAHSSSENRYTRHCVSLFFVC